MSDVWAKLVGHSVNGVFPLRRYLGGSNHSVVFLTESAKHGRSEIALKLVPAVPALAQLQLARWRASAAITHPHLLQIFEAGQCQIGERHFLYVATDYADQNLAQLLERRALTEEETREMLVPVHDALAYLHDRKLVQGRLKPSNILVVGDQIKLASDTIRPISETGRASNLTSAYMPPEARDGTRTAASDVWALGITLCEALTRKQPTGLHSGDLALPSELPATFRGVVGRCLSRKPQDRPTVSELQVWVRGAQLVASASRDGSVQVIGDSGKPAPRRPAPDKGGSAPGLSMGLVFVMILGALALFVMGWMGVRSSWPKWPPPAAAEEALPENAVPATTAVQPDAALPDAIVGAAGAPASALVPTAADFQRARNPGVAGGSGAVDAGSSRVSSPAAGGEGATVLPISQVIPDVPDRARRSIRGRVSVSVRLIVDQQGKVFAALVDKAGPSRYFERLALDAAQEWTFPPAASAAERLMLVQFEFTRDGATARAAPVK